VFTDALFAHLHRADQRRWGSAYLRGLLTVPGKKTVRRLAAAVTDSPTASQSLQQFVNSSPWEWEPARHELARWVHTRLQPQAWTVTTTILPKRGDHSCGVHRRFVPRLGQTLNCQLGVGLYFSDGTTTVPVDWRLHLPEHWTVPHLRQRARIPGDARPLPAWADTLDMVNGLDLCAGVATAPLVADIRDGRGTGDLLHLLSLQQHDFVVAVPGNLPVLPLDSAGRSLPKGSSGELLPARRSLALGGTLGEGPATSAARAGAHRGRSVLTTLVRLLSPTTLGHRARHVYRIFTDWHPGQRRPAVVWVTNMVRRRVKDLLSFVDCHTSTADTVRELERDFGLLDFEGRSYPGWHHYMTLVSAAHAYRALAGVPRSVPPMREPVPV
jgi:hypothetical protein